MSPKLHVAALMAVASFCATEARALCSGGTVPQEFKHASVVIRAQLVSEIDAWDEEPSPSFEKQWGEGGIASLYGLEVLQVFKGAPPRRVSIFMPHDSGAFYIDPHKQYLLFLNRLSPGSRGPVAAAGAFTVDYACGQSKPWSEVKPHVLEQLRHLSHR